MLRFSLCALSLVGQLPACFSVSLSCAEKFFFIDFRFCCGLYYIDDFFCISDDAVVFQPGIYHFKCSHLFDISLIYLCFLNKVVFQSFFIHASYIVGASRLP
ncbi:secreted protein [gut metagenome]|uniref:Secreted protein n=1 Tax=gut metagenome TaxID=749906 RepID=J9FCD0_9ZZZZ